jgi:hypothetical protein
MGPDIPDIHSIHSVFLRSFQRLDSARPGELLHEKSANQVGGNNLSVALSKRFSAPRASDK